MGRPLDMWEDMRHWNIFLAVEDWYNQKIDIGWEHLIKKSTCSYNFCENQRIWHGKIKSIKITTGCSRLNILITVKLKNWQNQWGRGDFLYGLLLSWFDEVGRGPRRWWPLKTGFYLVVYGLLPLGFVWRWRVRNKPLCGGEGLGTENCKSN